jgi:hypothetical protein
VVRATFSGLSFLSARFCRIGTIRVDYSQDLPEWGIELEPAEALDHIGRDVLGLLRADNDSYCVTEKGDQATASFPKPPQAPDTARSYILRARGYYTIHGL